MERERKGLGNERDRDKQAHLMTENRFVVREGMRFGKMLVLFFFLSFGNNKAHRTNNEREEGYWTVSFSKAEPRNS